MCKIYAVTAKRVDEWEAQSEVLGVPLVGSKSRGYNDNLWDDDLEVVLTDEAHAALAPPACSEVLVEAEGETANVKAHEAAS